MEPTTVIICGAFVIILILGVLIGKSCERDEWKRAADEKELLFRRGVLYKIEPTDIVNIKKHYGFFTIENSPNIEIKRGVIVHLPRSIKKPSVGIDRGALISRGTNIKIGDSRYIYEVQFAERLKGSKVLLLIKHNDKEN